MTAGLALSSMGIEYAIASGNLTKFEDVRHFGAAEYFQGDSFAVDTFDKKYSHEASVYYGEGGGYPSGLLAVETRKETPAEAMFRVAHSVSRHEPKHYQDKMCSIWFHMMWNRLMVAGGRIFYGAGIRPTKKGEYKVSLINCTTVGAKSDSLESIFNMGYEVAKVQSRGEGVGADITGFRPKGMPTNNAAKSTSGAVHWGEITDWSTGAVSQEGRRGALLISISGRHPEARGIFITVKSNLGKIQNANISIKIDDEMMQAYEKGETIELYWDDDEGVRHSFGMVDMREYMRDIAVNARDFAEPGVLFWTTAQLYSNSDALGDPEWEIVGVNACSEQPLNNLGQCTLAHSNWATLPVNKDKDGKVIYMDAYREARIRAQYVHWFLDTVVQMQIDQKRSALPEQERSLVALRRVGAGFTGMADFLIRAGVVYDSEEGAEVCGELAKAHCKGAYQSSVSLGGERGSFPANNPKIVNSLFMKHILAEKIISRDDVKLLRNVCSLTVAPVGTGSLMLQNYGSGIEPGFGSYRYRRSRAGGDWKWYFIVDPFVKAHCEEISGKPWPFSNEEEADPAMEEAIKSWLDENVSNDLVRPIKYINPGMKLKVMGRVQLWVDSAISVTFNLLDDATPEDIEAIYYGSWKQGLKGCSVYVYNDKNREPIIQWHRPVTYNFAPQTVTKAVHDAVKTNAVQEFMDGLTQEERSAYVDSKRPDRLPAEVIKRKGDGKKWYLTMAKDETGSRLREVFINTSDEREEHSFPVEVLSAIGNAMLQYGVPKAVVGTQLAKSAKDRDYLRLSRMLSISLGWNVPVGTIVEAIRKSVDNQLFVGSLLFQVVHLLEEHVAAPTGYQRRCLSCGSTDLLFEGGCVTCASCSSSKCG
jgi:ribonucleoside-diphosphate reductase alpha chain